MPQPVSLRTAALIAAGASLLMASPPAIAQFGGLALQSSSIAGAAYDVATIDFDDDGDLDIVVVGSTGLLLYRNDHNGSLNAAGSISLMIAACNGGGDSAQLAVGDVNGDGLTDLVVATQCGLLLLPRTGPATFAAPLNIGTIPGTSRNDVSLGDIDGDGDLDIAACRYNTVVRTFLNDGMPAPTFPAQDVAGSVANRVALGDLDGDGDADLLAGRGAGPSTLDVFERTGDGYLPPIAIAIGNASYDFKRIRMDDLDGDGDLDFVYQYEGTFGGNFHTLVRLNNGSFNFSYSGFYGLDPSRGKDFSLADLEGDGDLDLVLACQTAEALRYAMFPYTTSGNSSVPVNGLTGVTPDAVATVDLDGNSSPDVVMTLGPTGGVRWWLNQTDVLAPSDFNLLTPGDNALRLPLPGEPTWGQPAGALAWQRAVAFTVSYVVEVADDEMFESVVWTGPAGSPAAQIPDGVLAQNTRYWWRVHATSQGGTTTSPVQTFTTRAFGDGNLSGNVDFGDLNNVLSLFGLSLP